MEEVIQEKKRAIRAKLDTFSEHVGRRTVMFLWENDQGIPGQNGTGVLLAIGNRRFIVTAAHVTDRIKLESDARRPTFVFGCGMVEKRPIPLDRFAMILSPLDEGERRPADIYDIAAVELSRFVIDGLKGHNEYLELPELDLTTDQNDRGHYLVYGVAAVAGKLDLERRTLTTESFPIFTDLFAGALNELVIFDPAIGLVFNFDAHAGGTEGSPRVAPSLGGISGCGIWRIGTADKDLSKCDPRGARLVAIEHKEASSSKVLVGTRIKFVLQMIFNEYQDLRGTIASIFPSLE